MSNTRASKSSSSDYWALDLTLLLMVCGLVLWLGLGSTRLWDQDEGYYASVAREMFDRDDWVVPTFNQELFAHKPPLMYWGMLAGFRLFGVCEFATRWVSAIFGTGMVLLTYRLGRMLVDRRTGILSALVLVSSLMFTVVARSATADVHLGFFVLLALSFWLADAIKAFGSPSRLDIDFPVTRWQTWLLIYISIALAVLSKGPIGFAFPIAILGTMTLLWPWVCGRTFRIHDLISPKRFVRATLSMQPFAGSVVLMLVAAPWFWLVNQRTEGAFLQEFFGVQHLERFSKPMDNHSGPIYYYVLSVLVGFFPWTSFAIPIGLHAWKTFGQRSQRVFGVFLSVWLFFYFVVFSLASTKLPNYIIPAYPALALWIGTYVASWLEPAGNGSCTVARPWRLAGWSFMLLSGVVVTGLTAMLATGAGSTWFDRLEIDPRMLPSLVQFVWLGAILLMGGVLGMVLYRRIQDRWGGAVLVCVCIAWVALIWQRIVPSIDRFQTPQQIAMDYIAPLDNQKVTEPAVVGMFRPSMVFYSRGTLEFCQDDQALEGALQGRTPSLVVINQSSQQAERLLNEHGYKLADSLESFPKRGLISVYRR